MGGGPTISASLFQFRELKMSRVDAFRLRPGPAALKSWSAKVGLLAAALALTLLSSNLERTGPGLAQYGNLCGASHNDPCLEPRLNGGFPLAYLFDAPGVSVERKLSFAEDEFRAMSFVLDLAVYIAIILLATRPLVRFQSTRRGTHGTQP